MDGKQALLLDLWGVVHDGSALYPGVREALAGIRAQGVRVLLVSNAPRRAHKVIAVLRQLGVADDAYEAVVSSGEVGFEYLSDYPMRGRNYIFIGPQRDADVLDGLDYVPVAQPADADFILNAGFGSEEQSMGDFSALLAECRTHSLPMLCLNPDREVVKISGERYPCAGVIALAYEALGGEVMWFGKPYPAIYRRCMERLQLPAEQVLAVGDGLLTDIAGARGQGIESALVAGGILKMELGLSGGATDRARIETHCAQLGIVPDYVIPALRLAD